MAFRLKYILFAIVLIFNSCQDMPTEFKSDNPLDTLNPVTGGDPFQLQAVLEGDHVLLKWRQVEHENVTSYHLYRSVDGAGQFSLLISTANTTCADTSIADGHSYTYKVIAAAESGAESSLENVAAVQIVTAPLMYINDNAPFTFDLTVTLTLMAPTAAEMWISHYSTFSDGAWQPYSATISYNLLNNEGSQTVYAKFRYSDGSVSQTVFDAIHLDLTAPPMVYVPAGEFVMGSPDSAGDSDEHPRHTVFLDGFWIDKYEVTNDQYAKFLSSGNAHHFNPDMQIRDVGDGAFLPADGYEYFPVVHVTYDNARAYASWRGQSLPTEAQWEKAARGTDERVYPWGTTIESNHANFWNNGDPSETRKIQLTPVGFFNGDNVNGYLTKDSQSPYGAYDMAGNVREWCLDWYDADYYNTSTTNNPSGPGNGTHRVTRGGSFTDDPYYLRTAARSPRLPVERSGDVGFRCARW